MSYANAGIARDISQHRKQDCIGRVCRARSRRREWLDNDDCDTDEQRLVVSSGHSLGSPVSSQCRVQSSSAQVPALIAYATRVRTEHLEHLATTDWIALSCCRDCIVSLTVSSFDFTTCLIRLMWCHLAVFWFSCSSIYSLVHLARYDSNVMHA